MDKSKGFRDKRWKYPIKYGEINIICITDSNKQYIPSKFWNITRHLGKLLNDLPSIAGKSQSPAFAWNHVLRKLGYSGFADKSGKGIIHQAEPIQAVFLNIKAFDVIDKINNVKEFSQQDILKRAKDFYYNEKPIPKIIIQQLDEFTLRYLILNIIENNSAKYIDAFFKNNNLNVLDYLTFLDNNMCPRLKANLLAWGKYSNDPNLETLLHKLYIKEVDKPSKETL